MPLPMQMPQRQRQRSLRPPQMAARERLPQHLPLHREGQAVKIVAGAVPLAALPKTWQGYLLPSVVAAAEVFAMAAVLRIQRQQQNQQDAVSCGKSLLMLARLLLPLVPLLLPLLPVLNGVLVLELQLQPGLPHKDPRPAQTRLQLAVACHAAVCGDLLVHHFLQPPAEATPQVLIWTSVERMSRRVNLGFAPSWQAAHVAAVAAAVDAAAVPGNYVACCLLVMQRNQWTSHHGA